MLGGKEKSAGVPLVFGPRAAKGTPPAIEACLHGRVYATIEKKKITHFFFFFFSEKKKKGVEKRANLDDAFPFGTERRINNNNKSPNDAAIGLVRSRRFV